MARCSLGVLLGAAIVGSVATGSRAWAEPAEDTKSLVERAAAEEAALRDSLGLVGDAKTLFARGRERRLHDDCGSAISLFRKAYALYPAGLGSLRNMAECSESLGRFASARRFWLDLEQALSTRSEPKYDGWTQDARDAAARLAAKVATLTIDVVTKRPDGSAVTRGGLAITLNGEPIPPELIATPLERDPGHYFVAVSGHGVVMAQEVAVDLTAGTSKRVALSVVVESENSRAPLRAIGGEATPAESDVDSRNAAARRTGAWTAIGFGAAGVLGAGISFIVRQSALDTLKTECPQFASAPCPPAAQDAVDRGHTASALIDAFGVVAVVGVTTGLILFAVGPKRTDSTAFLLSPAGVSVRGTF